MGRKDREEHWRHQEEMAAKADKVLDRASKKGSKEKTWRGATAVFISKMNYVVTAPVAVLSL